MKKFTLLSILFSPIVALAGTEPIQCCNTHFGHTDHNHHNHENHVTPIGVMGGHLHEQGDFMLSYRYMFMNMQPNFNGTDEVSISDVLADYMVSPVDMQMEMHMIGIMYGLTDSITLLGMTNLVSLEMLHETRMGNRFTTSSEGLGDTTIGALFNIYERGSHRIHGGLSVVLPTAETNEEDFIPAVGRNATLPYPMQLGSGSWGLRPSLTYTGHADAFSWGAQVSGNINLDENSNGYTLGDSLNTNVWGMYRIANPLYTSLRLQSSSWTNIEGQHDSLLPLSIPTADPNLRGGNIIDAFWGINYKPAHSVTLSAEIGKTIWQDLDGPQLGTDWNLTVGLQATF